MTTQNSFAAARSSTMPLKLDALRKMKALGAFLAAAALSLALAAATAPLAHAKNEPVTDRSFVQDTFSNSQIDTAISKVALQKSASQQTKKLAKAVIKENDTANVKLRELAAARKVDIPTALDKEQQQQLAQLQSSDPKTVDTLYRQHMQQTLTESQQLFDQVAKNPRADAELRVFASQRLPAIKKQQQMLDKMSASAPKVAQRQAAR